MSVLKKMEKFHAKIFCLVCVFDTVILQLFEYNVWKSSWLNIRLQQAVNRVIQRPD